MEQPQPLQRIALEDWLLLAAVLLLPWAFGGVEIWAYRGAAFLLVGGAAVAFWKRGAAGWGLGGGDSRWLLPAFLLAAWAAAQLVPLPPSVIGVLSPAADRIYTMAVPGYAGASTEGPLAALEAVALETVPEAARRPLPTGEDPVLEAQPPLCLEKRWRSLSLQPSATHERLFWYLALLLGFLTVRQRVGDKQLYRFYRGALFSTAALLALFALVQDQTWNGKIYWIRRPRFTPEAFGPYVSPTHFVGVMELFLPWLAGYAWALFRRLGRDEFRDVRFVGAVLGGVVCLVASIAAASKAGALLILSSLGLLGLIGARRWRTRLIVIGLALALAAGGIVLRTETRLGERVESYLARAEGSQLFEGRVSAWAATAEIIRDFPVAGTGFGSYGEVATRYSRAGSAKRFFRAHNDYLEVVAEGGWLAAVLIGWLTVGFGIRAVRRLRRRDGSLSVSRLGLALGLGALAVHAMVDFNHQIPANALLFVTLAALLVATPNASINSGRR
jgi:O-antigen ligase